MKWQNTREVQKDTYAISEKLPNAISKLPRSVFSRVIDDNWGLLRIVPIVHKTTKVAPCGSLARLDAKLLVILRFQKVTTIHCKVKAQDTKSWVDNAINKVTKISTMIIFFGPHIHHIFQFLSDPTKSNHCLALSVSQSILFETWLMWPCRVKIHTTSVCYVWWRR